MISVALATYNGEKFIFEQLSSILNQTVLVDEVIITDDHSKDKTISIIKKFIDDNQLLNWNVFVNEKKLGFSSNFFEAVKKTKGDIIFLADQDDVWENNKVERMTSVMDNNNNIKLLSSNFKLIDGNNNKINKRYSIRQNKLKNKISKVPFSYFIGNSDYLGCSMCFRKELRDILNSHKNIELNLSLGHDWYFSIVSAAIGDFFVINEPLFKRRIHGNNSSMAELRKTTFVSSTRSKRIKYLSQIIIAHKVVLNNYLTQNKINESNKGKLRSMIHFNKKRLNFIKSKNIFIWLSLLFNFNKYYQNTKTIKGGVRMYIADFLYAYEINWNID